LQLGAVGHLLAVQLVVALLGAVVTVVQRLARVRVRAGVRLRLRLRVERNAGGLG